MFSEIVPNSYLLKIEDVVVDVSMLYEVAGGEPEYIKAMVSTFISTVPSTIKTMEENFAQQDYASLSKTAHFVKSSLAIIKIDDAYTIATKIETNARNNNPEQLLALIEELRLKVTLAEKILIDKFGVTPNMA